MNITRIIELSILVLVSASLPAVAADASGVALTPPMGWSSWNTFGKDINQQLVHQAAEALISSG